jgi:hypothetical protein
LAHGWLPANDFSAYTLTSGVGDEISAAMKMLAPLRSRRRRFDKRQENVRA